jgi:putative peptidoglycan lipid II flippase
LGIILGGIIGGASLGPEAGIVGLCFGVVAGAFVGNLFLPIFQLVRLRAWYKPSLKLRHPGVIKMGKLMLPILIGFSFPQVQMVITRFFGSYLPIRSITWLDNSSRLIQIPIGIFAQGLGVAIFPGLAALFASGKIAEYRERIELGWRAVLLLTIPATLFLWLFGLPVVQAIYMHGRYQLEDAQATASAMNYYALGIFAISGVQLIARGFYARQDTMTPIIIGTASTLAFIGLSWILIKSFGFGYRGLALASSIASILNFILLLIAFEIRGEARATRRVAPTLSSILKQLFASFIMAAACLPIRLWFNGLQQPLPLSWTLIELALGVCVSGLVYITAIKLMRLPEFDFIFGAVRRRLTSEGGGRSKD